MRRVRAKQHVLLNDCLHNHVCTQIPDTNTFSNRDIQLFTHALTRHVKYQFRKGLPV